MNKKLSKWIFWLVLVVVIAILSVIFAFFIGSVKISFNEFIKLLNNKLDPISASIFFDIRLPRIILGFAVGGALAISGVFLQGIFRNPLVEPYSLGISGGAALGICLIIISGLASKLGAVILPFAGFIGSISVIVLVYALNFKKQSLRLQGVLLTGVMVSFIASSLVMLLMAISGRDSITGIIFWIMGSLDQSNFHLIMVMVVVSLAGLIIGLLYAQQLNAFSLGEEEAIHLGIDTKKFKKVMFLVSSILTGCAVSVCGIIGFVGLVVPHFMRMLVGHDHRILIPTSFFAGASFLVICDIVSRTIISPLELPVGVITGIVGGSLFIYALSKINNVILGE